jgi:sulfite reductase (NADPH) flavoprotein alpha-component
VTITMRLAGRDDTPVTVSIQEPDAWNRFQRSQLTLDRATAEVVKWEPYSDNSAGRKLRTWMRGLHTGEALGIAGQTVAGVASLGGCFLVWTGLAMAWRRFRYRKREAGDAAAAERITSAIAIDSALIPITSKTTELSKEAARIDMEATDSTATNGYSHYGHEDPRTEWTSAPFNGVSVLILYGTVTGNAEAVAKKLAEALRLTGLTVRVRDMAHCRPNVLAQANCVLVVASTYGDGEPPDDAAPFWEAVVHGNSLDLTGVRFSVLALGNTTYDHFCKCGRELDLALERHGVARLYPRIDCDVDYDAPAKRWMDGVVAILRQERTLSATA